MSKRAPKAPVAEPMCRRCAAPTRTVAEVAAELRTWTPTVRAEHFRYEEEYAAKYPAAAPSPRELDTGAARYIACCADIHLPAMAMELDAGLCRYCAYVTASGFVELRRLVFEGLLAGFATSGRDERAEEEFELQAVAA